MAGIVKKDILLAHKHRARSTFNGEENQNEYTELDLSEKTVKHKYLLRSTFY